MIRGLDRVCRDCIVLAPSGKQAPPAARAKAWAWISDSAHSNLAAAHFSLAWAARFAARRGFAA